MPKAAADAEDRVPVRRPQTCTLDDFLNRQRVTGFLLIKDGEMLAERYQYDRKPDNRFVSHSMAKSIVSLAVGMALAEKKIASLDDTVAKYVPKLAGNPYGETTIRNMLRMASGVPFTEVYDGNDDLAKFTRIRDHAGLDRSAARIHGRARPAGHALSLCLQRDRGAGACCCAR